MQKEKGMSIMFAPFKFTDEALELLEAITMAESSFMFVKQKKLQLMKQAHAHLWYDIRLFDCAPFTIQSLIYIGKLC
ncbi:hypothetical protein Patl1_34347 [Pistacia atlantica]|uniref:Uncharacterized protein n=1 Tax=Pistacia atlantica TaxID=434234 RepID=A0ACC0ZPX9_9ROSI|nr:hypothetical protein Patl1_34347 [Pistacia atlantica]